ncbi:MAG TPA: DNA-3-methyladenine glycosylase [Gemmatimonadales bacterium]|nr:DNA-3-methyladenine glycosylase [Gemmatimonadales bacterium]
MIDERAACLPVPFFRRDAIQVARGLLGALLVSRCGGRRTVGRIVEVEAYLGAVDPASHAYQYRHHAQNEALYGAAGSWYVYLSYGMHWCANLVAGRPGEGAAILLRALEPMAGLPAMRRRRGVTHERLLCAGPGRLTQALGISRTLDRRPMRTSLVHVVRDGRIRPGEIVVGPRIGITRAADWPLRFTLRNSPWLSRAAGKT